MPRRNGCAEMYIARSRGAFSRLVQTARDRCSAFVSMMHLRKRRLAVHALHAVHPSREKTMNTTTPLHPPTTSSDDDALSAVVAAIDARVPFGPGFFLVHLRAFVRDRCPDPSEALPHVQIHLASARVLDVCHVIGVTPFWVALAVRETDSPRERHAMRTELVPYVTIAGVTIRSLPPGDPHIGFDREHEPLVIEQASAEKILERAAGERPIR